MAMQNSKSYKKDIRFPNEVWELIKNKDNVSKFVIEAVKEKLSKDNKQ